ncbi:MAG: phosphatase PAP2 family protein [Flavobacteriia bacterium]|nr:phosphatase PAP2 family protein [Flavobacteriia bacterium]
MDRSKDLLKWQWLFFISFFTINFIGLMATSYFGKDELHLYFNRRFHSEFFDHFFRYYTDIATTYTLIGLAIFIILKKSWRNFVFLGWSTLTASLAGLLIKRSLFIDGHRPTYYFELRNIRLNLVDGVDSQIPYTFPSGHTILAVILCFYLCIQIKNRGLQLLFCVLMGLVAIGRVYLSKHFVIDTVGGSMIGLLFVILGYYFIWQSPNTKLDKKILAKK